MAYLKKIDTGAVTENLDEESVAYQTLVKMRFAAATKISGSGGFGAGSGGEYTAAAGEPIWEAIAGQDAGFPDPTGGRVGVVLLGSIAAGSDETSDDEFEPPVTGKITAAAWVPLTTVEKNGTNYRTITLYEWRNKEKVLTETAPQEKVVLAKIETKTASATGLVANAMTVESGAEIKGGTTGEPSSLQVESKHTAGGVADPGGLVYVVYTRV
jgi:hypothetical protein